MKKIYLLSFFVLATLGNAFAQRTIDLSVDQVIGPTELRGDNASGTEFVLDFVVKNNGTDTLFMTDTLAVTAIIANTNNQAIITYPQPNAVALRPMTKQLNPDDTMRVTIPLNTSIIATQSFNARLIVAAFPWNRLDGDAGIATETAPGNADNTVTNNIIWFHENGSAVGIEELANAELVDVYPNPASEKINLSMQVGTVNSKTTIRIFDMTGRLMAEHAYDATDLIQDLDVSNLNAGMYLIDISADSFKATKKLQIRK